MVSVEKPDKAPTDDEMEHINLAMQFGILNNLFALLKQLRYDTETTRRSISWTSFDEVLGLLVISGVTRPLQIGSLQLIRTYSRVHFRCFEQPQHAGTIRF